MWPRRDVDRLPSAPVEVKKGWSYASTPCIGLRFHGIDREFTCFSFKHKDDNSKHAVRTITVANLSHRIQNTSIPWQLLQKLQNHDDVMLQIRTVAYKSRTETAYRFLQKGIWLFHQITRHRFLPHPFKFTVHWPFSTLYNLSYWQCRQINTYI
jgi:hypothetical protein